MREFVDAETAKRPGRAGFEEMIKFLKRSFVRVLLVEKTDRLYRNLKDYVTIDELNLEIHFVKENVILSHDSRSSEKFMHGIKVLKPIAADEPLISTALFERVQDSKIQAKSGNC